MNRIDWMILPFCFSNEMSNSQVTKIFISWLFWSNSIPFNNSIQFFFHVDRIRPVCLPLREPIRSQNFVEYTPFVAAWLRQAPVNKDTSTNPPQNVMRDWQLTILDNAECRKKYKSKSTSILNNQFDEKILCADNINAGQKECQADAGLMQPMFNPKARSFSYYQTGILTHGIGCKSVGVPVVYTRVQHFIEWIEKNI